MSLKTRLSRAFTAAFLVLPGFLAAAGPDQVPIPTASAAAAAANNEFGWSVFQEIRDSARQNENILFSPLSAWLALSLTSNGAEQETLQEMQSALRTTQYTLVETNPLVRELIQSLVTSERSTEVLRIANSVWVNSDRFELADKFQADAQTFYAVLPDEEVVTSASFLSANTLPNINAWVSRNTDGMIPSILDTLDPDMASLLLNALYFQGQWLLPFSVGLTGNSSFQLANGTSRTVSMMNMSPMPVPLASDGAFKMISLGFRSGDRPNGEGKPGRFQLDLMIPEESERSIFSMTAQNYQTLLAKMKPAQVRVAVPRFEFSYQKSLTELLQAIGIKRAFIPGLAQMTALGTPKLGGEAFISEVLQKTAVEMDENGFKAAAVTAVVVGTTSAPVETAEFIADRPFFIALRDRVTGAIIFQGIIANP